MNRKKENVLKSTIYLIIILLSLSVSLVLAQPNITVSGTVSDNEGTMSGVSVRVVGTTVGTITDVNGRFQISVPDNDAILLFSFVGYSDVEALVGAQRIIDIIMTEDATEIEEVVVTAMGIRRDSRALGYAISTVKGSDMVLAGATVNPLTALYGKAAGVGIQSGIAGPTGGVNIKIRGAASLSSESNVRPLFVVDGVPIRDNNSDMSSRGYDPLNSFDYGSGINDINPEDIESMEILKGAKASVLYGSLGANGVVLITTKRGAKTRGLGVQLSYQHTIEQPFSYIDWQNEYGSGGSVYAMNQPAGEHRKIVSNRYSFGPKFDGSPIQFYDGSISPYQAYPNNFIDLFRRGNSDNLTFAITGGNDKGNMRVAYTNTNYNGIMENFWQKKNILSFSGQMNVSHFASFEFTSNLYHVNTHNRLPNIQGIVAWGIHRDYDYNRLKDIYMTEDGFINADLLDDGGLPDSSKTLINVWWNQNNNKNLDSKLHNVTSVRATLRFTPWLYFIGQGGIDYTDTDYSTEQSISRTNPYRGGKYAFRRDNSFVQNYDAFLNFENSIINNDFHVHAFVGTSYYSNVDNNINVSTTGGLTYPGWYSLDSGQGWPGLSAAGDVRGHSRGSDFMTSIFGTTTFSWKSTYYLEFQARRDRSSTLPPANNSYFYPGVSFTWNFTENFKIPLVNYGKLYTSFADVGRPATRYFTYKAYNIDILPNDPNVRAVDSPSDLFAGDLEPERKREFEIGLSARMFNKNRMEFNFSFYTNNIYNQIMSVPLSRTTGAENIRINAGNVKNWGYELFVKGTPVLATNYKWDLSFTMANQYSKVVKLYPGIKRIPLGGGGYSVVADEGERYGEILMYDYVRDPNGNRVVGIDGNYSLDKSEMKTTGKNVSPDAFGGIMSDFYWKGLFLHIGLDYKFGGSIFSYSNYYLTGLGETKNTLKYRDEAHGGLAYYINEKGNTVAWTHNDSAPNNPSDPYINSIDGNVYHNGMMLSGMKEVRDVDGVLVLDANGEVQYVPNDIVLSSTAYYQSFISDMSDAFQPDALYRNDYIKFRELSIGYTLPKQWSEKLMMQKVTVSLVARNLFYLYKTLPNVDAESILGTKGSHTFHEQSYLPTIRTYGFSVNVSF